MRTPISVQSSSVARRAALRSSVLSFEKELFDGVQVGEQGQIEHPGTGQGNGLLDPVNFVAIEVVEDDDLSWLQCGAQKMSSGPRRLRW